MGLMMVYSKEFQKAYSKDLYKDYSQPKGQVYQSVARLSFSFSSFSSSSFSSSSSSSFSFSSFSAQILVLVQFHQPTFFYDECKFLESINHVYFEMMHIYVIFFVEILKYKSYRYHLTGSILLGTRSQYRMLISSSQNIVPQIKCICQDLQYFHNLGLISTLYWNLWNIIHVSSQRNRKK